MGAVVPFPYKGASYEYAIRALEHSMLPRDSVLKKSGIERVGRKLLRYFDFENPRRPNEVIRVYVE